MIVEMKGISKSFGDNDVLKGVDFKIEGGEVHSLMGENGAGKSTLMNVLTGLHTKDSGEILIDGINTSFDNPKNAEENGISFIHQELLTWPEMTVLENLFLNREISNKYGLVDNSAMKKEAQVYFDRLGLRDISFDQRMKELSVGQQQMIEIIKSLMTDCKILIMDEPTASLTDTEVNRLFNVIDDLVKNGVGIVYISHRMEEVFEISDYITVMRDGISVSTTQKDDITVDEVVRQMVGREITDYYPKRNVEILDEMIRVENLSDVDGRYNNISFEVRRGEVVGFAGLMGAGRSEIMRGIFGLDKTSEGSVYIESERQNIESPRDAIRKGLAFLTEDRKTEGLILDFNIVDNATLPSIESFQINGFVDTNTEEEFTDKMIDRLNIKVQSNKDIAGELSGGNQQKVVFAKWIGSGPKVLILDEPTRGVDVGAKREIYQIINELAGRGMAIIVVSSDLPEVLGITDRVYVIHEGKIAGQLATSEADQEKIMTLATGGVLNE